MEKMYKNQISFDHNLKTNFNNDRGLNYCKTTMG